MKTRFPLLLTLPLLAGSLLSCRNEGITVQLDFGTLIGTAKTDAVDARSQLQWITYSRLAQLVNDGGSFALLVHGSADTCTCYVGWHENLAKYVKAKKVLIYAIDLADFEKGSDYFGIQIAQSYDTLALFGDGKVKHQHTTANQSDTFVTDYAALAEWINRRIEAPKVFYVNEELLDGFYHGSETFTIYFGRDTCPDCTYLSRTIMRDYVRSHKTLEPNFFIIDFDVFRPTASRTQDPDTYAAQSEKYKEKKIKYGLDQAEDNPAGFSLDACFPTLRFIRPDGESFRGDVIEASGVFFNESVNRTTGEVGNFYFTKERYESAKNGYLNYLGPEYGNLPKPYMETFSIDPSKNKNEQLGTYEKPFVEALLDYAVKTK